MTLKDIIAAASTIGDVLKMMPDVNGVDDETIRLAIATRQPNQRLGERLVEMGAITKEQLTAALALQNKMREAKDVDELMKFMETVRDKELAVSERVALLTPAGA